MKTAVTTQVPSTTTPHPTLPHKGGGEKGPEQLQTAVVAGGGPAGAAAALGLLRRGLAVTVFERRARWAGRVCGAFQSPEAVRHLRWLGLEEACRAAGGVPVDRVRLTWGRKERALSLPSPGLALPRETLESLLLDAVRRAGGSVRLGESAPPPDGGVFVQAAGRFAGGAPGRSGGWYGWNASFENVPGAPGEMSLHFSPGGYVGVVVFPGGKANACGLQRRSGPVSWEEVFRDSSDRMPGLRAALAGARKDSDWRGVGPLPFGRRPWAPDAFPAGDAAAVGDPFFGEGIGRALAAGPMLYEAFGEADPLAAYRRLWETAFAGRVRTGTLFRTALELGPLTGPLLSLAARPAVVKLLPHLSS